MTTFAPGPAAKRPILSAAWRTELSQLFRLAGPIVATQIAWVAMLTTDTAMIGRLGPEPLAGASLSLMVFFLGYIVCVGVTIATAGLAAQAFGARQPRIVRRVIRQGLWVTILLTAPCVAGFAHMGTLLAWTGQPPEALPHAEAYMSTLKWCLPVGIAFTVLRNFVSALGRPMAALWVMLAGAALNALLDYGLIFGNFGLPRLELVGAGIATTTVNVLMVLALAAVIQWRRPFNKYQLFVRFWRPDWRIFRQIFRIGAPIAAISVMEAGFFIGAVFVIGQFGAVAIAAHMIAMQMPHITFMIPMGLSQAATVRVGHAAGRRDAAGAYRAGWSAIAVGMLFAAVMTAVVLTLPGPFAGLFLDTARTDSAAVLDLAVSLLLLAALFQIADALQAVAAGALRGLNDTAFPMAIAGVSYWGLGAGAAVWLAFGAGLRTQGIWIGFVIGLTMAAVLLIWRFRTQQRRRFLPHILKEEAAPLSP
jgi:MATE family multidrug resistance protein